MTGRCDEQPASSPPAALALTMGDPAGVGPDIALMAWESRRAERLPAFAVYADPDLMSQRALHLGVNAPLAILNSARDARSVFDERLPLVPVKLQKPARAGAPDAANAPAAIAAIDLAVADIAKDAASAIVTNPISKSILYAAGFKHPGHTEYLGELTMRHWPASSGEPLMMLVAERDGLTLRVVPLTIHIPLREVPARVTEAAIIATAQTLADELRRRFSISSPRIAIAGLNPHAGENGAIGTEERDSISPAISRLNGLGLNVTGPHSADALFHAAARARYDAAIAMYHDQALIPLKTLAFDIGVNVTLGLPFVRTSPDHGTAFDIAGTRAPSPNSLIAALRLAQRMASRRAPATA